MAVKPLIQIAVSDTGEFKYKLLDDFATAGTLISALMDVRKKIESKLPDAYLPEKPKAEIHPTEKKKNWLTKKRGSLRGLLRNKKQPETSFSEESVNSKNVVELSRDYDEEED